MGIDTSVTLRTLQLGAADPITGWYAKTYGSESTIKMPIFPKSMRTEALRAGLYPHYEVSAFHQDPVSEGDKIKDASGENFEVELTAPYNAGNTLVYYESSLVRLPIDYDPSTYGVGANQADPRYRTRVWMNTYLLPTNLKLRDGTSDASYAICWADPPYSLEHVFEDKDMDLVYSIGRGETKPLPDHDHIIYGYRERIPITITTIDKNDSNGENLAWMAEQELRRISENYCLGSLREFTSSQLKTQRIGSFTAYIVECTLDYARSRTP
jgi:hypothetical protein